TGAEPVAGFLLEQPARPLQGDELVGQLVADRLLVASQQALRPRQRPHRVVRANGDSRNLFHAGSEIEQNASSSSVELPRSIITYRRGAGPVPAAGALFAEPLPSPLPEAERGSRRGTSGVALPAPRGRRSLLSFSPSPPRGGGWGEGFWKLSAPGDEQDIDSRIALQRGLVARPERVPGDGPIVGRLDKHVRVAGPPYLQLIGVQNQRCRALDGQAKQACPRSAPAR